MALTLDIGFENWMTLEIPTSLPALSIAHFLLFEQVWPSSEDQQRDGPDHVSPHDMIHVS